MDNQKYLQEIVAELLADTEWRWPAELRFMLMGDVAWGLLGL